MAKKQTRRSISVSRTTYERLKSFCETNNISMSQLVENRVNDFLGGETSTPSPTPRPAPAPMAPRPMVQPTPVAPKPQSDARPLAGATAAAVAPSAPVAAAAAPQVPMTSAAARYAIDPPPPIIKPKQQENAPAPTEKRADQIFTF